MENYILLKGLPDAKAGTEVIWSEDRNAFYYSKDAYVSPNSINYLTAGQVTQSPEWFAPMSDYRKINVIIDDTKAFGHPHHNHKNHRVSIDGLGYDEAKLLKGKILRLVHFKKEIESWPPMNPSPSQKEDEAKPPIEETEDLKFKLYELEAELSIMKMESDLNAEQADFYKKAYDKLNKAVESFKQNTHDHKTK